MRRSFLTIGFVLSVLVLVGAARSLGVTQFGPAFAAESSQLVAASPSASASSETSTAFQLVRSTIAEPTASAAVPSAAVAESTAEPTAEPTADPTAAPASRAAPSPNRTPAPTEPPAVVVASAAPTAVSCPAGAWFCYPRVGISGAIVPYVDCSGQTDVGTQIRSYTCLSDHYLMGHAYTQFGKITGWQVGDAVFAYGVKFTVTGAFVQSACIPARMPLAPLEMQTSLTPNACGDVLVVQAR